MTGRAGRTGGFSLGLVIILLYYVLLTAGEKAAMDGRLSRLLRDVGPDILLAAAAACSSAPPSAGRAARPVAGGPRRPARRQPRP